jgi:precorrin-6A/cobalt-precorrin-6A reductase
VTHRTDVIVTKNSGGAGAAAKLDAARALSLPVIMVTRPNLPEAPSVETVADALLWLQRAHDSTSSA